MSRREDIDNSIWGSEEWLDLTPQAKLLYFWSFTNPRCGMAGVYQAARQQMSGETGLTRAEIDTALDELRASRYLFVDSGWVWVRSRVRHLRTQTASIAAAILKDISRLPKGHPFGAAFCLEYQASNWGTGQHFGCLTIALYEAKVTREDWLMSGEGPDTPSTPPSDPLVTPSGGSETQAIAEDFDPPQTPNGGSRAGVGARAGEKGSEERPVAPAREAAADTALSAGLNDVVAILEAARGPHGGLVVEPASIDSLIRAYPGKDPVSAAHEAAAIVAEGRNRVSAAGSLYGSVLRNQKAPPNGRSPAPTAGPALTHSRDLSRFDTL